VIAFARQLADSVRLELGQACDFGLDARHAPSLARWAQQLAAVAAVLSCGRPVVADRARLVRALRRLVVRRDEAVESACLAHDLARARELERDDLRARLIVVRADRDECAAERDAAIDDARRWREHVAACEVAA
jgi:hypothetical protein